MLGSAPSEIARLDAQAAAIAAPTELLLRAAGIAPGMRVLDLGCGPGAVTFALAGLVGPEGEVVGLDQSAPQLAVAEERRAAAGLDHVRFVTGDARSFRDGAPFDAVVCRLLLFHLPDAAAVVAHHLEALRGGGLFVAIDYDIGAARSEPPVARVEQALGWIMNGFRSAAADPVVGARLALVLHDAGLLEVDGFGVLQYFGPGDPTVPAMIGGVVASLAPQIVAAGIADEAELGLDTLAQRLAVDVAAAGAVLTPPAVVGAWGRV